MQILAAILKKISNEGDNTVKTLCDLMPLSYAEIYEKYHDIISDNEARILFQQAQRQKKKNRFTDAKIAAHNNPQVKNIPCLHAGQSLGLSYENDFIPDRISEYAEPGMVSSMFSPAAYLTELYREARALHTEDSKYHLDKRRPDLKELSLSEENLNDEISTLELSNEVLFTALKGTGDEQSVLERLSKKFQPINLPYHAPFQIIKKVSELKKIFPIVNKYPFVINNKKTDKIWLKTICCGLSPALSDMLKDIYTGINSVQDGKLDELIKKYITDDISYFYLLKNMMSYFELTNKKFGIVAEFFGINGDANTGNIAEYKKNILKLKGVVSLYNASGLPLDTIVFALKSFNCNYLDEKAINAMINLKIVRDNYHLCDEDIAVLLGGNIVKDKINTDISQFDRIFNTPLLGDKKFTDNNKSIIFLSGNYADSSEERFIINCLKRAFGVTESLLAELCEFIYGEKQYIKCNIEFLSLYYRVILIARINHISVSELIILCRLLPDVFKSDIKTYKSSDDIYDLLYNVNYYTTWFNENKLSISMCYFLLRNSDEIVVSQGVKDIISEIKNGLTKTDFYGEKDNEGDKYIIEPLSTNELIVKLSPALSSVLGISSVNTMESVLRWMDKLKPKGLDIKELFYNIYNKQDSVDKKENKSVIFMIKMSVMINMIAIDDSLLSSWVEKFSLLDSSLSQLTYNFATIKMMTDANSAIKGTGEASDLVISELKDSKLSYKTIADVFNQNEKIVQQVLKYLDNTGNIKDYYSLTNVVTVLYLFTETGISPDDFTKLFGNSTGSKDYTYYYNLSKTAESTLEQDKLADLKGTINKSRSEALCSLYIFDELKDSKYKNNSSEVYKYLLIDTKISEETKTTRIAEAIASIQLYINNCLNNIEKEVQDSARTRQFFCNWEEYNRRYSTWASLSMLLYYPENYIDPVIRTGKTAMMDNLQQLISQEGIQGEAIDDAFRTYLTEFDQVANLNVISAYHNTLDIKTGKTYFIGHSGGTDLNYYLRNVNNNGVITVDGKISMPSSTWTDWKRIDCGINPYNNVLRPILFNNRVYIAWLEYSELIIDDKSKVKVKLCFSYLRYDDTWSETNIIDLSGKIKDLERVGIKSNKEMFNYYCSEDFDDGGLLFIFYNMSNDGSYKDLLFFNISSDFSVKYDCYDKSIIDKVKVYFDRPVVKKIINRYENSNFKVKSVPSKNSYIKNPDWLGELSFSMSATNFLQSDDKSKVICYFDFDLSVDKGLFRFSDKEKNNEYAEWLRICNDKEWYDCAVDYSIARINPVIVMDDGNIADSVVFLFNKTNLVYSAFLYNFNSKKRVALNLSDVTSIKVMSSESYTTTIIEELHLDSPFAGIYFNYNKLVDDIKSSYKKVCVYIEKSDAANIKTNDIDAINDFLDRSPSLDNIEISVKCGDNPVTVYSEDKWCEGKYYQSSAEEYYPYKKKSVSIVVGAEEIKSFDKKQIMVSVKGSDSLSEVFILKREFIINVSDKNDTPFDIEKNEQGAQYIKVNDSVDSRIRLNTLFASKLVSLAEQGIEYIFSLSSQGVFEPDINSKSVYKKVKMDFNGANALYFWELFYYAPMMVADILLQHQSYNEAERWLQYIFNPAGYIEDDTYTKRYWNVRPLEEDTQWNESLPDDTDPDEIALADPMHYKMATFMKTLELIIARGDKAYRELERDSLNEAKSWYIQALSLLGKEPVTLLNKDWSSPKLSDAADKTVQSAMQRLFMQVNNQDDSSVISVNSENTLTNLFKPQLNEKLISCRDTINQRLFNLRNGLSINGQRLYLPIFSSPADPRNMLESQVNNVNSEKNIKNKKMLMYRFPAVIENAKSLVSQLIEFGDKLLSFNESRDNEQLSELLIHQGNNLLSQSIRIQDAEINNLLAEKNHYWPGSLKLLTGTLIIVSYILSIYQLLKLQ